MKSLAYLLLFTSVLFNSCAQENKKIEKINTLSAETATDTLTSEKPHQIINPKGKTVQERILPPKNYKRIKHNESSFAFYLRNLPLKEHGEAVRFFDGSEKTNYNVYEAVIDLAIGNKDLHQCADAVMRLRAEYLWEQKRYNDIHFNFTNGFRVDYSEWMKGNRMTVKGNKSYWVDRRAPSNTYEDFWNYMELIFTYAGTLSLSKELLPVDLESMQIGDVFIWGGSPGHAVLVIDVVVNPKTKEKLFLLAQSYMPAQETQILTNQNNEKISPWYALSKVKDELFTPEWSFSSKDLKRFQE